MKIMYLSGPRYCFLFLLTVATSAFGDELSIVVRESKLHATPNHWSPPSGDLHYGDTLWRLSTENGWEKVVVGPSGSSANRKGYVHSSAVSSRRIILRAGNQVFSSRVEPTSIVLAGKGFNADVEELYRTNGKELDYQGLNAWEGQIVSDNEIREFLLQGGLTR